MPALLPAPAAASGGPDVRYSSTGQNSERLLTVPLTRERGAGKRSAMSLTPKRLGALRRGDRLRVGSEVQITTDCLAQKPRCAGDPYPDINPLVRTRLVIARTPYATRKKATVPLGPWQETTCVQRMPHREHHCVIVNDWSLKRIGATRRLPCRRRLCHVNLVVDASHPQAPANAKVVLGGNRPSGHINQDRGRVQAYRIRGAGKPRARSFRRTLRRDDAIKLDTKLRPIYSVKLDARPGDVIRANGTLEVDLRHLPYRARVGSQLVLARSPAEAAPRGYALKGATLRGEVGERNGFNCTKDLGVCRMEKLGLIQIRKRFARLAGNRPLYLNLTVQSNPKAEGWRPEHRLRITDGGSLRVIRLR